MILSANEKINALACELAAQDKIVSVLEAEQEKVHKLKKAERYHIE
jgi:hypothetical protein